MIGLNNKDISFILLTSSKLDAISSILYVNEYNMINLKGYYMNEYNDYIMAYNEKDNDELRKDIISILNEFDENSAIIKYRGESNFKRIFKNGSEDLLKIILYNTDSNNISYLYENVSFSFINSKRYWRPKEKSDFKVGMLIEYFNQNKWVEKRVENINEEYEKLYKLLIKYDKIRISSN